MKIEKLKFAAVLLDMAAEEFSRHGCNDFDLRPHFPDLWQRRYLLEEFEDKNGTPGDFNPKECSFTQDWAMMSFMADFLHELAKEES